MIFVQPKSLEEAAQVVRAWRGRPGETCLPEDYEGWHFEAGKPIDRKINFVKLAILTGYPIPEGFRHWDQVIKNSNGHWQSMAHWAAEQKYPFPADFDGWGLLDFSGTPVIHAFMRHAERVPDGFAQWDILDSDGLMVAHAYPMLVFKPLPPSFDDWHLRDKEGETVAHHAVYCAHFMSYPSLLSFPDDPAIWRLRNDKEDKEGKDGKGDMVLHAAVRYGLNVPESLPIALWHEHSKDGKTAIAMAREFGHAHLVAQYEALKLAAGIQIDKTVKSSFQRGAV